MLAKDVTEGNHNHLDELKGAEAVTVCIFLARVKFNIKKFREYVNNYYKNDFRLNDIRDSYSFNENCQGSVPQAIEAFLESIDYEDAVINAIIVSCVK